MGNITNQWSAQNLAASLKSRLGSKLDGADLPKDQSSLEDWYKWPDTKEGKKYMSKIINPKLLLKGDIIIRDYSQDYVAAVLEGGSIDAKYKIVEHRGDSRTKVIKMSTGPVAAILRINSAVASDFQTTGDTAKDKILQLAHSMWQSKKGGSLPAMFVCGIRGYYSSSSSNTRGVYDDAICVIGPGTFAIFKANTDPSASYKSGVASLIPGVYPYKPGNHGLSKPGGGYPAFRPNTTGEALPVTRDGATGTSKGIAINIHRGGINTTSSLGCQTIPPNQWNSFYSLVRSEMTKVGVSEFNYILCTASK